MSKTASADAEIIADALSLEQGRLLFAQECLFMAGAAKLEDLPPPTGPEIAFAGRSNVGKSSLVNALAGRRALARVSHTPGRTRQINLFDLGGRLVLADLPGYGYARAGKSEIAAWTGMVEGYLKGRPSLMRVLLLIDARHGPKPHDLAAMAMMDEAAVVYQVVLTKSDKLKPDELDAQTAEIATNLKKRKAAHPALIATSSLTALGIAELRAELVRLARP